MKETTFFVKKVINDFENMNEFQKEDLDRLLELNDQELFDLIFKNKQQRDEFLNEANLQNIMTRPIWTLMTKLPMFRHAQCGDLANSKWLEERVVNIPSSVIL